MWTLVIFPEGQLISIESSENDYYITIFCHDHCSIRKTGMGSFVIERFDQHGSTESYHTAIWCQVSITARGNCAHHFIFTGNKSIKVGTVSL